MMYFYDDSRLIQMGVNYMIVAFSLMTALPLMLQLDMSHPPVGLTGWMVFIISLFGVIGLMNTLIVKAVLRPEIAKALSEFVSRKEFDRHESSELEFRKRVDGFIDDYWQMDSPERRNGARRRGDPQ